MTIKNSTFDLNGSPTLNLKYLFAQVTVRKGPAGKATIVVDGDDETIKAIRVSQPNSSEVLIEGLVYGGEGITFIQSGRRSSISVRGRGVVFGRNIVGGSIVGGKDVVIVNGKVISGQITQIGGSEMDTITVTVPEGTELEADSVEELDSQGLNGKLYLSLDGQGKAKVYDVISATISCIGQTRAELGNAKGHLKADCSGQSRIIAKGNFDDIDADASGQSQIRIVGNCRDFSADASGMSDISFYGQASGKVRKHESDMSNIDIE